MSQDAGVAAALQELGWPDECDDAIGFVLYETFGRCVPPLAGLFLDVEACSGGPEAQRLHATLARVGLEGLYDATAADHLATPLRALGWLLNAEADAARDALPNEERRMRGLQAGLLDDHLLRALPPFAAAVADTGRALPIALVEFVGRTLLEVRGALDGPRADWRLPGPGLDLEDPDTDVRAIAGWLSTPSRTGLLLSPHTIERIGRTAGIPRGFGPRRRLIASLIQSAARYGVLADVVARLRARVAKDQAHIARWDLGVSPWPDRLRETDRTLALLTATFPGPPPESVVADA
jgi:hypothetical protein